MLLGNRPYFGGLENGRLFGMVELEERRASIQPIKPQLKISILEAEDIRKINEAALTILEEVGVLFPSEKALRIFDEANANVDFDKRIVRIPSSLVTDYLKKRIHEENTSPRDLFGRGKIFLPELAMAAQVMFAATDILREAVEKSGGEVKIFGEGHG